MTARALLLLLPLVACGGDDKAAPEAGGADGSADGAGDDGADTGGDSAAPAPDCPPAPLPVEQAYLPNFTGAEDFAFDPEGYLVSIDQLGNLVGIKRDGSSRLILPSASTFGAGTRFHPNGELLFNAADRGELVAVDPATGGSRVVLGGLEYPNGLEVDAEGFAYVAEQISGRVRRVDPDTGDFSFVARGLYNPNGLSFTADEETLYIGSFGGGTVWSVSRTADGGWTAPAVFGESPESPGVPPNLCLDAAPGTSCPLFGAGIGACAVDELGDARCLPALDEGACGGLAEGDACTTTLLGQTFAQRCTLSDAGALFCPAIDAALTEACKRVDMGGTCRVGVEEGFCYPSFEGVLGCYLSSTFTEGYTRDCVDRAEGDACVVYDALYPTLGVCQPGAEYGLPGLACLPEYGLGEHGGLDGVAADVCGNVYVTEYVLGEIWRFPPTGGAAERVVTLDSEWIPNLHWGNGVGGWERDRLYVMDRANFGVFELFVGVEGR
jgi:sugar lactone lactonase YvrE